MQQYKARNGAMQFKPSIGECTEMDENGQGFCLACGEVVDGVEPDAVKYTCECCGKPKVYGAAELVLLGLVH